MALTKNNTPKNSVEHYLKNDPPVWQGVYIHLPFCQKICPFCSFPVVKNNPTKAAQYTASLQQEVAWWVQHYPQSFLQLQSIYVGGGTPSLMSKQDLANILSPLLLVAPKTTLSIELNPDDVSTKYLQSLLDIGFNRFSFGLQSFCDESLLTLGRIHNQADNWRTLNAIEQAGLTNYNFDLIYGYLGDSCEKMQQDLACFLQANPKHISAYLLTLEKPSLLAGRPNWHRYQLEHHDQLADQFLCLHEELQTAGLACYEVSNFAKPSFESQQNLLYWQGKNTLGIGLGAFTSFAFFRCQNEPKFYSWLENTQLSTPVWKRVENISLEQRINELFLIGLRRPTGIDRKELVQLAPNFDWDNFFHDLENHVLYKGYFDCSKQPAAVLPAGLFMADQLAVIFSQYWDKQQNSQ